MRTRITTFQPPCAASQFYNTATSQTAIRAPQPNNAPERTRAVKVYQTSQVLRTQRHGIEPTIVQRPAVPEIARFPIQRPVEIRQYEHSDTFKVEQRCGLNNEDPRAGYGLPSVQIGTEHKLHRLEEAQIRAQRRKEAEARVLSAYAREDAHLAELNKNKLTKIRETRERYVRNLAEEEKERHLELQ